MDRVACPHCGFLNFSISAYCGRCERPVRRDAATPPPVTRPAAVPVVANPVETKPEKVTPPPVHRAAPVVFPQSLAHSAPAEPPRAPAPPPAPVPAPSKPAAKESPLTSVPPPLPPISLEDAPQALQPIELDSSVARRLRHREANIGELPSDTSVVVELSVPSVPRLLAARVLDFVPIVAVGMLLVFAESLVRGVRFQTASSGWFAQLAEWLSLYGDILLHAAVGASIFAASHSVFAATRGGQTLGRRLTDTVLVCQSAASCSTLRVVVRAVVGVVSLACFGAGFLYSVVDPYHRTWHDLICRTITVRRYSPRRRSAC